MTKVGSCYNARTKPITPAFDNLSICQFVNWNVTDVEIISLLFSEIPKASFLALSSELRVVVCLMICLKTNGQPLDSTHSLTDSGIQFSFYDTSPEVTDVNIDLIRCLLKKIS